MRVIGARKQQKKEKEVTNEIAIYCYSVKHKMTFY
jgi:hypothetical protein